MSGEPVLWNACCVVLWHSGRIEVSYSVLSSVSPKHLFADRVSTNVVSNLAFRHLEQEILVGLLDLGLDTREVIVGKPVLWDTLDVREHLV